MKIIDAFNNKDRTESLQLIFKGFIVVVFLTCLSYITYSFYLKTVEMVLLRADVIVNGQSIAPYQYRILSPFAIDLIKQITGDYSTATKAWIFFTISLFYVLCFYFFLKESGSILLTMIFCLALWGTLPSGMWAMMKQEFIESSLILLLYYYQRKNPIRWMPILLITILSSLNRETFLISLVALGITFFISPRRHSFSKRDWIYFTGCSFIYVLIYVSLRAHYGLRPFDGNFLMLKQNFSNCFKFFNLWTVNYAGAGIFWIYVLSLVKYWKDADRFILVYVICFLGVSFFISSWEEHRIFYPLYPLIFVQVLRFLKKEFKKEIVN